MTDTANTCQPKAAKTPPESGTPERVEADENRGGDPGDDSGAMVGISLAILAGFLFVSSDSIVKTATAEMSIVMVMWGRFMAHTILMLILFPGPRILPLFRVKQPGLVIGRGAILLICTGLFFTAIKHIGLAEAAAIMFVSPFFVVALSIPILGEKVGLRRWSAVAVGFLGILIILRPGFQDVHWSYLLVVAVAFFYALYTILTRTLSFTETTLSMWLYTALVGTVGTSAVVWFFWQTPTLTQWIMMAVIGVVAGGAHYIVIHAYRRAPASMLAPFQYVQIIWATAYGLFLFGDFPDMWTFVGAAVIIAGGLYVWLRERQLGKQRRSASWRGGVPR